MKIMSLNSEEMAFWIFSVTVAFTACGPVIHYIGLPLVMILLIYGKIRDGKELIPVVSRVSGIILNILIAFALWSIFAHIYLMDSFYVWGKGASVVGESILVLLLAVRVFNSPEKRLRFAKLFVVVNAIFSIDVIMRNYYPMLGFNQSLNNGNTAGVYALLLIPFLCPFALWYLKKGQLALTCILVFLSVMILVTSFSSGAWAAGLVQALVLACFTLKERKLSLSVIIGTLSFVLVAGVSLNSYNSSFSQYFIREMSQIMSVADADTLTNHRIDIWRATCFLAKRHLFTGLGRDTFTTECEANMDLLKSEIGYKANMAFDDSHNMYLAALYGGGLPALLLLISALCLSIYAAVRLTLQKDTELLPWGLIALLMLIGQVIQGMSGDIFDARRDIGVIFWACWGLFLGLPALKNVRFKW